MQVFLAVLFFLSLFGLVTKSMIGRGLIILFVAYLVIGLLVIGIWKWIQIMPWWWWPIFIVAQIGGVYEVEFKKARKAAREAKEAQQNTNLASAAPSLQLPESGEDKQS